MGNCFLIFHRKIIFDDDNDDAWRRLDLNWGEVNHYVKIVWYIVHSKLDIVNKSVRPFLFAVSNKSLYQI